jgi:hypothetical protein
MPTDPLSIKEVTNSAMMSELLFCFQNSSRKESVGKSLLFDMHFLVILHPETYESRLPSLPHVVNETVKAFYATLTKMRKRCDKIVNISHVWHFKFGPASEFNNETIKVNDIKVIGMLTGLKQHSFAGVPTSNARVTMRAKVTNVYDQMHINLQIFTHINFLESGTFEIKFSPELKLGDHSMQQPGIAEGGLASIEYYIASKGEGGKYTMKDKEIVIARKEAGNQVHPNYLLIDSEGVSNPHARIRYNEKSRNFQIASFSRNETRVNEIVIDKSELDSPRWSDLPDNSQILLNAMITLEFRKIQSI